MIKIVLDASHDITLKCFRGGGFNQNFND